MRLFLILCLGIAVAGPRAVATDTDTIIPYAWGTFKPVKHDGGEAVILEAWNTKEGRQRLERSHFKNDFYRLAGFFQPQITPVYAGVASLVIVLNAIRVPKHLVKSQKESELRRPRALGGGMLPFPAYNQINFFNEKTDAVKDRKILGLLNVSGKTEDDKKAFKPGTSLADLKALLEVYGVKSEVTEAKDEAVKGLPKIRKLLKDVVKDDTRFLLANFKGDELGAPTEGTVSPIVAYDEKTDSVLVMDVTGQKNPWYWAPVEDFYRALHTQYGDEGLWRGWLVVSE